MKRRTLYLPVETKPREFLGKTLLAAKAVDRGWRVLLGGIEMHDDLVDGFAPGVVIENNIPDGKADRLNRLVDRGYRIADLCEESIAYPNGEDYCSRKVGRRSLAATDIIFATGARCEGDIRQYRSEATGKLFVTGNPRFDTLMPGVRAVYEDDARRIRERYGKFLLVNTNFSASNPYKVGLDLIAELRRTGKLVTPGQVGWKTRQIVYKARHMKALQVLLREVVRAGVFDRIVLRPHPSENHDVWRTWASDVAIDVEYDGSANAWMLAAEMVLHPGCTTGVEALLLDRPVVSFVPEPDIEFINQADIVSVNVADAAELIALAPTWRADDARVHAHVAEGRSAMRGFIENVEPPLATPRILDVLDGFDVPATGTSWYALKRACAKMDVRTRLSRRAALRRTQGGYRLQKFPGLVADEVRTPIARWIDVGVVEKMPDITAVGRALLRLQ